MSGWLIALIVVLAIIVLAILVGFISVLPDLRRYLRLRAM